MPRKLLTLLLLTGGVTTALLLSALSLHRSGQQVQQQQPRRYGARPRQEPHRGHAGAQESPRASASGPPAAGRSRGTGAPRRAAAARRRDAGSHSGSGSGEHGQRRRKRRVVEYVDPDEEVDPAGESALRQRGEEAEGSDSSEGSEAAGSPASRPSAGDGAGSGSADASSAAAGTEPGGASAPSPGRPEAAAAPPVGGHFSYDALLHMHKDPEEFLPAEPYSGDDATTAECIQPNRAMQRKCRFRWLMVSGNRFTVFRPRGDFPNPIYPADDQTSQLAKPHHRYYGHRIAVEQRNRCQWVVRRPTIFLFRLSGHSPYHLWENNLGPFHATLQQWTERGGAQDRLNSVSSLLVSYVDLKPATGPKAPHLLDALLQSFTDLPLINASRISRAVCFQLALVGIASRTFNHWQLIREMQMHVTGSAHPRNPEMPAVPRVLWVSRNHPTVKRGRKIANEAEVVAAVNTTLLSRYRAGVEYLHMQDYPYSEQVRIMMAAQVLLGPHGAGIANCIWMPRGSVAMEFAAPKGKTLFGLYHQMCKRSDVTHLSFVAAPDPRDRKADLQGNPRLFSNMVVPVDWMLGNLSRALGVYEANRAKYGWAKKE
eukprot:TRINITY_DN25690_c0_g1_i1.p1 TRINITY_DN25690_c0_g1~~TRINITY_DN25690_c0_g1_i1.p1  ORF type:complete len:599 (+),score=180.10 TRINITY_DN25690_c0_g1_i1:79-1875(+)